MSSRGLHCGDDLSTNHGHRAVCRGSARDRRAWRALTLGGRDRRESELLRWTEETFGAGYIVAVEHAGRGTHPPGRARPPRAWTCCSSTPATTSPRPSEPATRSRRCYGVNVVNVLPEQTVAEQDPSTARICSPVTRPVLRAPQGRAAKRVPSGYKAWVTGIRRVEAPTRANAPLISFDEGFGLVKINPIAPWTEDEMDDLHRPSTASWSIPCRRGLSVDRLRAVHRKPAPR